MEKISTYYKWQFLRRNNDYQTLYEFYKKFYKDNEDYMQVEFFVEDFLKKYSLNRILDYSCKTCPDDLFAIKEIQYHTIGPYSLDEFNDQKNFINIKHDFATSTNGKFDYLKNNDKKLLTVTIDISGEVSALEIKSFSDKLKPFFKMKEKKGQLKGYLKESDYFETLLITYDLKKINNKSYQETYRELKKRKLKYVNNDYSNDKESIKSTIQQDVERAESLISNAVTL